MRQPNFCFWNYGRNRTRVYLSIAVELNKSYFNENSTAMLRQRSG
jgi:hypothetical protein